jgi:hypothetical protein
MGDGDKAAFGLAAALGLPWIMAAAIGVGMVPGTFGTAIAVVGVASLGVLTVWASRALLEIRAYAGVSTR